MRSPEAALWAFRGTDNFRDGCLAAVNLGDDAGTKAAVYGQLARCYYGAGGIPNERLGRPHASSLIVSLADSDCAGWLR